MRRFLILLLALCALLVDVSSTHAQVTALRFGRLIDGRGGVIQDALVIVEGERVSRSGRAIRLFRRTQSS